MARRRYQAGTLRKRGKRNPYWELQWREDFIRPEGTIGGRIVCGKIGLAAELTRRQAQKVADEKLRPLNHGGYATKSTIPINDLVEGFFIPNFFPTLKVSTQNRYRRTLQNHLIPAFGKARDDLCLCRKRSVNYSPRCGRKLAARKNWCSILATVHPRTIPICCTGS